MNWFITENKKRVSIFDIPCLSIEELRQEIINLNKRVVGFFGKREDNNMLTLFLFSVINQFII